MATASVSATAGLLRPLRVRDFRLLWIARTISLLGDGVLMVALAWQTLRLVPQASALGLVLVARGLPRSLLLLVGGVFSDRVSRRGLMVASDLVHAVAIGAVAVLSATGSLRLWHLVLMGAVSGIAGAFFFPASSALLPQVLPQELLLTANSLTSISRHLTELFAGAVLGGLLLATVGPPWAFGLDAASFVVSALLLAMLRPRRRAHPAGHPPASQAKLFGEVSEGLAYARRRAWLWVSLATVGTTNLIAAGAFGIILPLLISQHFQAGPEALGWVYAGFGIGGGLAALLSGQLGTPRRPMAAVYATYAVACLLIAGLGVAPSVGWLVVLAAGTGILSEYGELVWMTLLQKWVPEHILGRVASLDWFVSLTMAPIAMALAGPAVDAAGVVTVLGVGGLASAALVVTGFLHPGVRQPEQA